MLIAIYIALFPGHVGGGMLPGNEANRDIVFATFSQTQLALTLLAFYQRTLLNCLMLCISSDHCHTASSLAVLHHEHRGLLEFTGEY